MSDVPWLSLFLAFLAALIAGAINSIAGGGTLLTFPVLIALGLDEKMANITSTIGIWPGSLGGAWGYRDEIAQESKHFWPFYLPSLVGGAVGAGLLLWTSNASFKMLAPWLILLATLLFVLQGAWAKWQQKRLQKSDMPVAETIPQRDLRAQVQLQRWPTVVGVQFLVGVYGGYFGGGIGILMLAALGFLGLRNIYQMNGIKNIGGLCINGMAILLFLGAAVMGKEAVVQWQVTGAMAIGAVLGGYYCTGIAKRIGPTRVRWVVVLIGLLGAFWTAYRLWANV